MGRSLRMAVAVLIVAACGNEPGAGGEDPSGATATATGPAATAPVAPVPTTPGAAPPAGSGAAPAAASDSGSVPGSDPGSVPGSGSPPGSDSGAATLTDTDAGTAPAPVPICPDGPFEARPFAAASVAATEVCSGLTFAEGPVWLAARGALLLSDFQIGAADQNYPGRIVEYVPRGGCSERYAGIGSNGLALDNDGHVILCRHDDQTVSTLDPSTGETSVLVGDYQGAAFSSPNDVTMRADGNLYFTDPAWQLGTRTELLPQRAYRREPGGALHVIDDIPRANGITLSPDGSRLYVSNTDSVRAYELDADGAPGASTPFAGTGSDGMTVDCAGNLYITTGAVVRVFEPDGDVIGEVVLPDGSPGPSNVAFGGAEGKTLFITAQSRLHAVELAIPGWPY